MRRILEQPYNHTNLPPTMHLCFKHLCDLGHVTSIKKARVYHRFPRMLIKSS